VVIWAAGETPALPPIEAEEEEDEEED